MATWRFWSKFDKSSMRCKFAFIGLLLDILDWHFIGLDPNFGVVIDLVATGFWVSKVGPLGFLNIFDVDDALAACPLNCLMGMLADDKVEQQAKKAAQLASESSEPQSGVEQEAAR